MSKYYRYQKNHYSKKSFLKAFSFLLLLMGLGMILYIVFPFLSWQLYSVPIFSSQYFSSPIPQNALVASNSKNVLASSIDYTNAKNWFPNAPEGKTVSSVSSYTLSIPKIGITNATVSTIDNDLASHLVHYEGTALPPENGNTVIFGHSTLPQLFNPTNYKTIFAKLHTLAVNDTITINIANITYTYRVYSTIVTDPLDTSIFSQDYTYNHLTLVTCTPPGTVWKRLIVKARIEKL